MDLLSRILRSSSGAEVGLRPFVRPSALVAEHVASARDGFEGEDRAPDRLAQRRRADEPHDAHQARPFNELPPMPARSGLTRELGLGRPAADGTARELERTDPLGAARVSPPRPVEPYPSAPRQSSSSHERHTRGPHPQLLGREGPTPTASRSPRDPNGGATPSVPAASARPSPAIDDSRPSEASAPLPSPPRFEPLHGPRGARGGQHPASATAAKEGHTTSSIRPPADRGPRAATAPRSSVGLRPAQNAATEVSSMLQQLQQENAARHDQPSASAPAPTTVEITIGRVEIRAEQSRPAAPRTQTARASTLDDYLRRKAERR